MGQFPTTHWSLVDRAGHSPDDARKDALAILVTRYAPALKAHLVVRKRITPHQADDLLQGFIANEVLDPDFLKNVHSSKGKFRSLLLTALDRHVIGQIRYDTRLKRHAANAVSIDEAFEPTDRHAVSPQAAFDLAWARQVLDEALRKMESECRESDRADVWGVFDARILAPLVRGEPPPPYDAMVEKFGITSATQASNLLVTGKRMFVRSLRTVIGEYARSGKDIDAEIADLQKILSSGGGARS